MTPVDFLLEQIYQSLPIAETTIPKKDLRIIVSLKKQVQQHSFLTENQSRLLIKILKENLKSISVINPDAEEIIFHNEWSQAFRVIEKIRKIYRDPAHADALLIEFNFDKKLKDIIQRLNETIDGVVVAVGSRCYAVSFTEQNIHAVITAFAKEKFEIDQKILDFYNDIKKILDAKENPFDVFNLKDSKLKAAVEQGVGVIDRTNLNLLQDRKFRYQYQISEKNQETDLATVIANRQSPKIFINSIEHSLTKVLTALKNLHRFPLLVIFEGHDAKINKNHLDILSEAAAHNILDDQVGIYFRFETAADPLGFNHAVSSLGYNKILSEHTSIAGIANNKLPKFMVKNGWKPMSVISFTNGFKNNKSSVYTNDVDLVIYYGDKQPLYGGIDAIV